MGVAAIVEPHAPRVGHSRRTETPTKGLTAGIRGPHMDIVQDASLGDPPQRNVPAVPLKTGHHVWRGANRAVWDRCQ